MSRRQVIRVPRAPVTVSANGQGAPSPEKLITNAEGKLTSVDLGLFDRRKPVVIGIDQSLVKFGLVAYSHEDDTAFCWLYEPKSFGVRRLVYIRSFVARTMQQVIVRCGTPEHVTMEGYSYGSEAAREKMGECGAATKLGLIEGLGICNEVAYPTIPSSQQVKKFVTSNGNAKKQQMLLAVYKKWGVTFADDNLADAYALARMAAVMATGTTKFDYEMDVIRRIEPHTEWELRSKPKRSTRSSERAKSTSSE